MSLVFCLIVLFQFWCAAATNLVARNDSTGFVSVQGGSFQLEGSLYRFYGTNVYWAQLATDDDIDLTFHDIATAGLRVVRVWAFNDVPSQPSSGTYFQILNGGKATINEGPDGLQRLDKVVATATKYGLKLVLTLTNNWNPVKAGGTGALPRGYLSNDYGGMDLYVSAFHSSGGTHDLFYTDSNILSTFKNYLAHVIPRYANSSTVLGWELGNDLRCSSTLPASSSCNTHTISNWVNDISGYIKSIDSQHLITAGDGGFYCLGCPKLFAKKSMQPTNLLSGPSFDGSYGVDTEDILAIPCIDFGSFQLFPDQIDYFPETSHSAATKSIGDGGKWSSVHSDTALLLGKPEVLTAAAIVTKEHWPLFVPFNETARRPDGTPCAGVEQFQEEYAFTSWASVSFSGNIGGVLEYLWLQAGLTSQGTTHKRALQVSFNDGAGHYSGPATGQTTAQVAASLPPPPPPP